MDQIKENPHATPGCFSARLPPDEAESFPLSVTAEVSQRTHHRTTIREQECPASAPLLSGSLYHRILSVSTRLRVSLRQAATAGSWTLYRQPRLCLNTIPHQRGMSLPVWECLRNETQGTMRIAQEASLASEQTSMSAVGYVSCRRDKEWKVLGWAWSEKVLLHKPLARNSAN